MNRTLSFGPHLVPRTMEWNSSGGRGTWEGTRKTSFRIPVNQGAKVMNGNKTCIVFPAIEGLVYLLRKKDWMTAEEADSECYKHISCCISC